MQPLLSYRLFAPLPGAGEAPAIRAAVFRERGLRWPPVPGDHAAPYAAAASALGRETEEIQRLLYADAPNAATETSAASERPVATRPRAAEVVKVVESVAR